MTSSEGPVSLHWKAGDRLVPVTLVRSLLENYSDLPSLDVLCPHDTIRSNRKLRTRFPEVKFQGTTSVTFRPSPYPRPFLRIIRNVKQSLLLLNVKFFISLCYNNLDKQILIRLVIF